MKKFKNISNVRICGYRGENPRYMVECEVEINGTFEAVTYVADADDVEETGRAIHAAASQVEHVTSYEDFKRAEQATIYANHDEIMRKEREFAYQQETDKLVPQVMRGEVTQAEYEAAVAAIKASYPFLADMTIAQKREFYSLLEF